MWILLSAAAHADTLALRDLAVDACGTVTGTVDVRAAFFPRTVAVSAGTATVDVAVPAFASSVPFALGVGRAAPSATLAAEYWFVASAPATVWLPPLAVALTAQVPPEAWAGEPFPVEVEVDTACEGLPIGIEVVDANGERLAVAAPGVGARTLRAALPREGVVGLSVVARDGDRELARSDRRVAVGPPCVDRDGDGHLACRRDDCDDADPSVFPGAKEVVGNRRDDDCDGVNGRDADRDGFEDASAGGDDCDPAKAWVHPGAAGYVDRDGDGAAPWRSALDLDCDGAVDALPAYDCADLDPRIPRPEEPAPTDVDEDCDGLVDEGTVVFDDDGDGLAEVAGDCDDGDATVRPGRPETPDCRDEDCDGTVDEGVVRPRRDDVWEPNDTDAAALPGPEWVRGFFGGHWRESATRVAGVTRDARDVERYTIDAHDGTLDTFHVTLAVSRMGDDRAYRVTVEGPGGSSSEVLSAPGAVSVGGSAGRDDSGTYQITVEPVAGELDWCPVTFTVSTG